MSTSVTIHPEQVASIRHGVVHLDASTTIILPPGERGAAWCRYFASLLSGEADRLDTEHKQALRDLAEARREVERIKNANGGLS